MGRFDNFCQSCGMPLDKDPGQGGTEKDGSKSTTYCSLCYVNGAFKDNFTDSGQMVAFVKEKLKEQGIGPIKRWFYTSHIPQLGRWKKA
ncbi:MAG: zinc ribbon domain-containing protein [Lewinellaceae bacterium]|nr:zinc ribbon domain-containing protein [Lewinellaceae bacterium]